MTDSKYTRDPNSGLDIRRTDNGPKEDDIFMKAHQFTTALTEEGARNVLSAILKEKEA